MKSINCGKTNRGKRVNGSLLSACLHTYDCLTSLLYPTGRLRLEDFGTQWSSFLIPLSESLPISRKVLQSAFSSDQNFLVVARLPLRFDDETDPVMVGPQIEDNKIFLCGVFTLAEGVSNSFAMGLAKEAGVPKVRLQFIYRSGNKKFYETRHGYTRRRAKFNGKEYEEVVLK